MIINYALRCSLLLWVAGAKKVAREKKIETSEVLYSTARVMEVSSPDLCTQGKNLSSLSVSLLYSGRTKITQVLFLKGQ